MSDWATLSMRCNIRATLPPRCTPWPLTLSSLRVAHRQRTHSPCSLTQASSTQIQTVRVQSHVRHSCEMISPLQPPKVRKCCRPFFHSPRILTLTSGQSQDLLVSSVITALRGSWMVWTFTRVSSTTLCLTSHFPRRSDERHDDVANKTLRRTPVRTCGIAIHPTGGSPYRTRLLLEKRH